MRRIHGFILCRETDEPLSNLVVAAFDSELSLQLLSNHMKERSEIGPELWSRFGRRLGSTLSDARGHFAFEDAVTGFSARAENPNLLLAVFAPEDVTSVEHPFPAPPERRVLYVSPIPRLEAGAEEAYIIRILRVQLERFGISRAPANANDVLTSSSQRYVDILRRSHDFATEATRLARPILHARLDAANSRIHNTKVSKLAELTALSTARQEHPQRLKDRKGLPTLMKTTLHDGLTKLSRAAASLDLTLTEAQLNDLGLQPDADGNVSGSVNPARVTKLLSDRNRGIDLIRRSGVAQTAEDVLGAAKRGGGNP